MNMDTSAAQQAPQPPPLLPSSSASASSRGLVADSCFDFLMMEIVRTAAANSSSSTSTASADAPRVSRGLSSANSLNELSSANHSINSGDDADRELAYFKLEMLGYRVGMSLAERSNRDRPRFSDNLDIVKYICKDFWLTVFRKQVDNLKTNHRGVFVLTDNNFKGFARMCADGPPSETVKQAFLHLAFPCGLIRGALANLGVTSVVMAEVGIMPQCTFQIKLR